MREDEENKPVNSGKNGSSHNEELPPDQLQPGKTKAELVRERWDLEGEGVEVEDDCGVPEIRSLFNDSNSDH